MTTSTLDGVRTTLPILGSGPTAPPLVHGTRVRDYVVKETLAQGGFGTVYRVEHALLRRPAALKVLHEELAGEPAAVIRFEREALAVNLIRHPGIVDVFDYGQLPDGRPYYVMELLEGEDLDTRIRNRGRLSIADTVTIVRPLCEALAAAHEAGVIHRDLKAPNVFLAGERVVLLDFGVAKLTRSPDAIRLTTSQQALGTPTSMAPEQIAGRAVDARTDVYALGALLYHMLTGRVPFADESPRSMPHMHLHARRPRPSEEARVTPAIDRVVTRAMAIDAADRPAGALELLAELEAAAGQPRRRADGPARLSVGVHVSVTCEPGALDDPDDRLLADLESLPAGAAAVLDPLGFVRALGAGNGTLWVRPLGPAEQAAELAAAVRRLWSELAARAGRDARVKVAVAAAVDDLDALLRLSDWVAEEAGGLRLDPRLLAA